MARLPLLIAGHEVQTEEWMPVTDPADGSTIAEVGAATQANVDTAVKAAAEAMREWQALGPVGRARAMDRYASVFNSGLRELAELMHTEMGKPLLEAEAEVARAGEVMTYFAAEAERVLVSQVPGATVASGSWIRPAPIGVVAAITPWNFPVALVSWKLGPALAAGCPVICKPAIEAPLAARRVCEMATDAELPPGLVSCLTGDGPLLGEALATHPGVAKVAFTGSRRVAEQIAAWTAPRLKALSLELGGHGPLVVLPDADLDVAAEVAVVQGYANAGQACYSVNRVLAPSSISGELLERMRERIDTLELGPMATDRGFARHETLIADARERGAMVEGGEPVGPNRLAPALVTRATPGTMVVDEEPFTPIVTVMEMDDVADAVAEANRPDYGLVGYVCGGDLRRALEVAESISCGTVVINGWRVVTPYAPYAGWNGSGVGTELGRPGLEAFVRWQHLRVLG